jgi:dTDP-4-amino-4,6-dideoxygalactose transaminase
LKRIRPVGNNLLAKSRGFDEELFSPFKFRGYGSGTQALASSLIAIKYSVNNRDKNEVIIPAYTCPDVVSACYFCGLKIRLVDLEKDSCRIDLTDLKRKINKHTLAIVAINFLGFPEDILSIKAIARNIPVIEDSAQGMFYDQCGSYWQGDLIILSFGRGKPLNLLEGGAVLFRDKRWASFLPKQNSKLNEPKKALLYLIKYHLYHFCSNPWVYYGITQLPIIKIGHTYFKNLSQIRPIQEYIVERLSDAIIKYKNLEIKWYYYAEQLSGCEAITQIDTSFSSKINLLRFPCLIHDSEKLTLIINDLKNYGISRMYEKILPDMEDIPASVICNPDEDFTKARTFAKKLITLPSHNGVKLADQKKIIDIIKKHAC